MLIIMFMYSISDVHSYGCVYLCLRAHSQPIYHEFISVFYSKSNVTFMFKTNVTKCLIGYVNDSPIMLARSIFLRRKMYLPTYCVDVCVDNKRARPATSRSAGSLKVVFVYKHNSAIVWAIDRAAQPADDLASHTIFRHKTKQSNNRNKS